MKGLLDASGFLPIGIHKKTWQQLESLQLDRWRLKLLSTAKMFCDTEFQCFSENNGELYLVGSFFSDKKHPSDLDLLLHLPQDFTRISQYQKMTSIIALHDKIQAEKSLDVWITTPTITTKSFVDYFQYIGDKSAQIKNISPTDKRGIIEVISWKNG